MSAAPEFIAASPQDASALLVDFIRYRKCRPRNARELCRSDELSWIFRGYAHRSDANGAWRAWSASDRICLVVAQIAESESRVPGATVLDVRFFDPDGQPFPPDLWERLPDGTWLQCDPPRA